jgi:acylphosphatase
VQGAVLVDVVNVCDELAVEGLVANEADGVLEVILGGGELQEREDRVNGLGTEGLTGELGLGERAE